jgi:hypothetical protein
MRKKIWYEVEKKCSKCGSIFKTKINILTNCYKKENCSISCGNVGKGCANKGKIHTIEHNNKIKNSCINTFSKMTSKEKREKFGHRPWNKGLTKKNSKKIKLMTEKSLKTLKKNGGRWGERNPFYKKHHSEENKELFSKLRSDAISNGLFNIKTISRGYKGWYFSEKNKEKFWYDSILEKLRMVQLDNNNVVLKWTKRHGIRIKYINENKEKRNFVPDFLIYYINEKTATLEEIKGYDDKNKDKKKKYMELYCKKNNLNFNWLNQNDFNNHEYRLFLKENKND